VLAGLSQIVAAIVGSRRSERTILSLFGGLVTLIIGVASLVWPGATVVVVAVLFGVRILLVGVVALIAAREMRVQATSGDLIHS
jgi:uncharacterized membrane protein HdeD (DUF308 family)